MTAAAGILRYYTLNPIIISTFASRSLRKGGFAISMTDWLMFKKSPGHFYSIYRALYFLLNGIFAAQKELNA